MNYSPFKDELMNSSFQYNKSQKSTELETNDFESIVSQQTITYENDMESTQVMETPYTISDHRKINIISELDYFLNRRDITVEPLSTIDEIDKAEPLNVYNQPYISILTDRLQHHHNKTQKPHTSINEVHPPPYDVEKYSVYDSGCNNSVYNLTKNYIALATEYKMWNRYRIHRNYTNPCLVCLQYNRLVKVFFPCEHRCICESCFLTKSWKECPLCKEGIRLTLVREKRFFFNPLVNLLIDSYLYDPFSVSRIIPRTSKPSIGLGLTRSVRLYQKPLCPISILNQKRQLKKT